MSATPDWADLFDAPLDDEPFTEKKQAAADAALERIRQGHYVLLDDLHLSTSAIEPQPNRSAVHNRFLVEPSAT